MTRIPTSALVAAAGIALLASAATVMAQNAPPVINQKDKTFSQELVTVGPGGAVRFVNDDNIAHNVYTRDPSGANRPGLLQRPGDQADIAFERAGDHQVLCAIHPRMRMTVRVQ